MKIKNRDFMIPEAMQINGEFGDDGRIELCVALEGEWKERKMKVTAANLQQMADTYAQEGKDILFDYDHNCLFGETKAAGWGKDLQVRDGKIYVSMEPTPEGRRLIENKEYRYLSPVYQYSRTDKVTGKKINSWKLHSVALTNTPYLSELPAIRNTENGGSEMEELLKLLGATDEKEAIQKVTTMANDAKVAQDEAVALKAQINAQEIEMAINSKKLLPAQKELATKLINSDRALYDEFLKSSAQAVDLTKELAVNAAEGDGLDPYPTVKCFTDLLDNPELSDKMEKEDPKRFDALYNKFIKEGR